MSEKHGAGHGATVEKLLFLHIPKTAGTALRNLIAECLGEERVTRGLPTMFLDEALLRYGDSAAICGHFRSRQGERLPPDRIPITVLRDPLERFLSDYSFRKFDNGRRLVDERVRALDINEFVAQLTEADMEELNLQTSLLFPLGTDSQTVLSWQERTEAARSALERFGFVGIQEEFDDFVCMLCARFAWPARQSLAFVNTTSQKIGVAELSDSSCRKLEEMLAPDRSVYAAAVERFRSLRRAMLIGVDRVALVGQQPEMPEALGGTAPGDGAGAQREAQEFGNLRAEITGVLVAGEMSGPGEVLVGERLCIYIDFVVHELLDDLTVGIGIRDEHGMLVFGTNSWLLGERYRVEPGVYSVKLAFVYRGERGEFRIDANLIRDGSHLEGCYHWKEAVAKLWVNDSAVFNYEGRVLMDASVAVVQVSSAGGVEVLPVEVAPDKPLLSLGRLNPVLEDFAACITPLVQFHRIQTGTEVLVHLELENTGREIWYANGKRPVCLSYHWCDEVGQAIEYDGLRTSLGRDVAPGERIRLHALLRAPQKVGAMSLIWTLVQEDVAWFDERDAGSRACRNVTVVM